MSTNDTSLDANSARDPVRAAAAIIDELHEELQLMRQKLRIADERLRIAQSVAGAAGMWDWDLVNDVLHADARFAALCNLNPTEAAGGAPGKVFFEAIHPDDRPRVRIAVAGVFHGAEVFSRDFRVLRPDGEILWVAARGESRLDDNDNPLRFTGVLTDITEQKRVEERLRVAQSAGGVGTFEFISGFGTAEVSAEFCRLLGFYPADALPIQTVNGVVHVEDRPIIGGREDAELGPSFREFRVNRADTGEERWLARRGENFPHETGYGYRFVGVIYDVTDAKGAQQELSLLNETLEQRVEERTQERDRVWNLTRDLTGVWGANGRYRAVNPAWYRVLGLTDAEVIERKLEELIHTDDRLEALAVLNEIGSTADGNFDARMQTKAGDERWINWRVIREGDDSYSVGRDVTERKLLEDQLRQSQKMEAVGQLTGGLAHDFNNLLTGIIGGVDITRRRLAEGRTDDIDRFLDAALASAERAAALTHRLLAFSRRQSLDMRPIDVGTLVKSMTDLITRTIGEQTRLNVDIAPDLWAARGDANQLESAILNLTINARDAMRHGGSLTVAATNRHVEDGVALDDAAKPGDYVEVSVADNGVGMSPEVVAKAFDPFFTTKPLGKGTGLGLSMIYGFAQQSGGHVVIESELGEGTIVRLRLPRQGGDAVIAPMQAWGEAPRGAGEAVLVVEDDAAVRQLVLEVLRELGYVAIEASESHAAMLLLTSGRPLDLMITDVGLPGLDGRELAEIARTYHPGLKILFITGYAQDAAMRHEFLGEGMEMVTKPFAIEALAVKIREMIGVAAND